MKRPPTTPASETATDERGALPEHAIAEEREDRADDPTVDVEELGARFLEESTESGHRPRRRDHLPAGEPVDEIASDLDR